MKIIFFGTPDYVVPILNLVHKTFKERFGASGVVAVVTQEPKPIGREQKLTYSPVDTWAYKKGIPVIYDLSKVPSADLGILAAYGELIPELVISHLKFGILNIHPSLLPKYRGASPVQAAIASGDSETGVTIIKIDRQMDHGPVVSQFSEGILGADTFEALRQRLFARSAEVLTTLIPSFVQGRINLREQNHGEATYTILVKKEYGFIPAKYLYACLQGRSLKAKWKIPFIKDYSLHPTPYTLDCFIRAMDPWPGAWTQVKILGGKDIKILRLKILKAHLQKLDPKRYTLIPDLVQLEGKGPVSWEEFKRGYPNAALE